LYAIFRLEPWVSGALPSLHAEADEEKLLSESRISITVNDRPVQVANGTNVAVAVLMSGDSCRVSVEGEARAPLCGMGICMECRVTIDGVSQQRSCQLLCAPGMHVVTG
jgi:aerobic-type carbon monoxide dehydrogenase small subunit (CoxS/CutS family)